MSATSKTDWFWSDWLGDPAVRRLTPAARGVWIDCLALMATACPIGYLCDAKGRKLTHEEVARFVNATADEVSKLLAEIIAKGAASVDRTGRIYNRRMVRRESIAAKKRLGGKVGGSATRLKWQTFSAVPGQMPQQMPQHNKSPPSLKKERITSSFLTAARAETGAVENSPTASTTNGEAKRPPRKQGKEEKRLIDQAEYMARVGNKP